MQRKKATLTALFITKEVAVVAIYAIAVLALAVVWFLASLLLKDTSEPFDIIGGMSMVSLGIIIGAVAYVRRAVIPQYDKLRRATYVRPQSPFSRRLQHIRHSPLMHRLHTLHSGPHRGHHA